MDRGILEFLPRSTAGQGENKNSDFRHPCCIEYTGPRNMVVLPVIPSYSFKGTLCSEEQSNDGL